MGAAGMGMRRGCRVAAAPRPAGGMVAAVRRWDVRLEVLDLPPDGHLHELVKIARADAVFLGTRWSVFDPDTRGGLNVPVFEPIIGLTDDEVGHLASRIESA